MSGCLWWQLTIPFTWNSYGKTAVKHCLGSNPSSITALTQAQISSTRVETKLVKSMILSLIRASRHHDIPVKSLCPLQAMKAKLPATISPPAGWSQKMHESLHTQQTPKETAANHLHTLLLQASCPLLTDGPDQHQTGPDQTVYKKITLTSLVLLASRQHPPALLMVSTFRSRLELPKHLKPNIYIATGPIAADSMYGHEGRTRCRCVSQVHRSLILLPGFEWRLTLSVPI